MIKIQILSLKTIEGNSNRSLTVRVRIRFLLLYSELNPTDPSCNMLRHFTWTEKYEEAMSDEHPHWKGIKLKGSDKPSLKDLKVC